MVRFLRDNHFRLMNTQKDRYWLELCLQKGLQKQAAVCLGKQVSAGICQEGLTHIPEEIPGNGALYEITGVRESTTGWSNDRLVQADGSDPAVLRIPAGRMVRFTPEHLYSRYASRSWSSGCAISFRYILSMGGTGTLEDLFGDILQSDGQCQNPAMNEFFPPVGTIYEGVLASGQTVRISRLGVDSSACFATSCITPRHEIGRAHV